MDFRTILVIAVLVIVCACLSESMPGHGGNKHDGPPGGGKPGIDEGPPGRDGGPPGRDERPPGRDEGHGKRPKMKMSQIKNKLKAFNYVKDYYMVPRSKTGGTVPGVENLQAAIMNLQHTAGLKETGEIDEPTARALTWPRCGNNDTLTVNVTVTDEGTRKRRYILSGSRFKWQKFDLTYKIENYPNITVSVISEAEVDEAVSLSFKLWSDQTPLTFTRVYGTDHADIVLLFGGGMHTTVSGDPKFDGPGGTLAHAFTPNSGWGELNGDVHYDDAEVFTHKKYFGRNLQYVTAHEVGHALGLDHSNTQGSLMWPFILGYTPNYVLPEDDKLGIQAIYGLNPNPPREEPEPTSPPSTTPKPTPAYCSMVFDDIEIIRGEIYAFSGMRFWRFSNDGHLINSVGGTLIKRFFKGGPSAIHGIIERWYDEKVIIIKGKKLWEMSGTTTDAGYPKLLSDYGLPKMFNCTMHRAADGITFYFKEKLVYSFDEFDKVLVEGTPVKIHKTFIGIPRGTRVSAAFTGIDGYHYLLEGTKYYKVNPDMESDGVTSNFAQDFLRCPGS